MNRRDFLTRPPRPAPRDYALLRFARPAMATTFEICIPFGTPDAATAADAAFDLIDRLEDQLTVYRKHSEISRLNRLAAVSPVVVEPRLFALLQLAQWLAGETGGAFDVTAGPLVRAWGFFRRQGRVPDDAELADAFARVGFHQVELNADDRTVHFRRRGVEINLGSIGKGYALDRAAELLRRDWGIGSALLHAGGSSVVAVGHPPGGEAWAVTVRHPWDGSAVATVYLRDQGLATSAATFQHFAYNQRKLGHLIDPRTGRPAEGTASATAVAPTAAEADALSTAFYVLGEGGSAEVCGRHADYGAAVLPDGHAAELLALGCVAVTRPEPEPVPA